LWRDFVPVVFHVTYWDYLGWKDRFGDPAFDARQRACAAGWGSGVIYTPGLVLDGEEWRGWGGEPPRAAGASGTLTVSIRSRNVAATFAPAEDSGPYSVFVALLGFGAVSDVTSGENAGRRLHHEFVVRGVTRAEMKKKDGVWRASVVLAPSSAPMSRREGLAAWIVGPDGRPAQAVGGLLP
jgi:hypothetical protein